MYELIFTSRINTRGFLRKVFFGGEEGFGPIKGRWEKKASERGPANKLRVFISSHKFRLLI